MGADDFAAMRRASLALQDAKNELIRAGVGSDLTLSLIRHAETHLARQMELHSEAQPSTTP